MRREGIFLITKYILLVALSLFLCSGAFADVVYLDDGRILFASYASSSGTELVYSNALGEIRLEKSSVIKTEPNSSILQGKTVKLVFTDNSEMLGQFIDFDEDIGYFIELSFGTLTVPLDRVVRMVDPLQARKHEGANTGISAKAVAYLPVGNDNFSYFTGVELETEFRIPSLRGVFWGAELALIGAENNTLEDMTYTFIQLSPRLEYRYLGFRTGKGFLSNFVPFAAVGSGVTVILIEDLRPDIVTNRYGALSPHAKLEAGLTVAFTDIISVSLNGTWMTIFQKTEPFNMAGGALSVCYEF